MDLKNIGFKKVAQHAQAAAAVAVESGKDAVVGAARAIVSDNPGAAVEAELQKGPELSVIRLVDALVERAHLARASDIHFDPREKDVVVRLRIDGVLLDAHRIPSNIHSEVISRLKILCGLRTDEHQAAQDGRFHVLLGDGASVDVRTSIV